MIFRPKSTTKKKSSIKLTKIRGRLKDHSITKEVNMNKKPTSVVDQLIRNNSKIRDPRRNNKKETDYITRREDHKERERSK